MRLTRMPLPWRRVGDEVLLVRPGRRDIDSLRGAAAAVWLLLERPSTLQELREAAVLTGADPLAFDAHVREAEVALRSLGVLDEVTDAGR